MTKAEIWDLHCHLSGVPGNTPETRLGKLIEFADRMGIARLCVFMGMEWSYDPSPEKMRQDNDEVLRVEQVDTAPLVGLVKQTPGLRLILLNALGKLHGKPLNDLIAAGEVYVEISMLEGVGGVGNLLAEVPENRMLFGSHAPLFYFESALLKLKESPLTQEQMRAMRWGNAQRLLAK